MIFDTLARSSLYESLHPGFVAAFEFLRNFDPSTADGKYPIIGEEIYAGVERYESKSPSVKQFEAHRHHIDVQYLFGGSEMIYYTPIEELTSGTPYNEVKDTQKFQDPARFTSFRLSAGEFAIFFPHDGHKPSCQDVEPSLVSKVVVKIRVG